MVEITKLLDFGKIFLLSILLLRLNALRAEN